MKAQRILCLEPDAWKNSRSITLLVLVWLSAILRYVMGMLRDKSGQALESLKYPFKQPNPHIICSQTLIDF
jgi:hypothetical protein